MIDIHSHIIPGVDDGPSTIEESLGILAGAVEAGVTKIIATPHYNKEYYEKGTVERTLRLLKERAAQYGIEILQGYEIRIHRYEAQMPEDYSGLTLGGSRYILLELPFDRVPKLTFRLLYELQLKRFIPVIAHPERCKELSGNRQLLTELIESGCLLQVDSASIVGVNGRKAKKLAKKIITSEQAAFVASDAHNPAGYLKWYVKSYKKVQRWIGKQRAKDLFTKAPEAIFLTKAPEPVVFTDTAALDG